MAAVSHSRTSRNLPIRDTHIPELPAPPLGGGKSGRVNGEEAIGLAALLDAAMRACDFWQDSPQAREAMRRECMATPEHLRADLLAHFRLNYSGGEHG